MKVFKTKNKHNVPFGRQIINTEVYLKISSVELNENGVIPHGYHFIMQNNIPEKLDNVVPSFLYWEQIEQLEKSLKKLSGKSSLKEVIYQRAEEFTLLKLQQEGTSNYGINPKEWEEYVPKKEEQTMEQGDKKEEYLNNVKINNEV